MIALVPLAWVMGTLTLSPPLWNINARQIPGWDYMGGAVHTVMRFPEAEPAYLIDIPKKPELFNCPKFYSRGYLCPYHNQLHIRRCSYSLCRIQA